VVGAFTLEGEAGQVRETLSKLMHVLTQLAEPAPQSVQGGPPQAEHPPAPVPAGGIEKLSYSSLALLFRCSYAFHLKQAGVIPAESEEIKRGKDFHKAVAAVLRGEQYDAEYEETRTQLGYVQETIDYLRSQPDLRVEPRAELEVEGVVWEGYADAIAGDTIYEFKTTARIPTEPSDSHRIQASLYASLFNAKKAKLIYVSQTRSKEFEIEPLAQVQEFLAQLTPLVKGGLPPLPTGLTHPYGCEGCGFRAACRYYQFLRGDGLSDLF